MPVFKVLLFDADGTLFDFKRAERTAVGRVLSEFGLPCREGMFEAYDAINDGYWKRFEAGEIDKAALGRGRFADFVLRFGLRADGEKMNRSYLRQLAECPFLVPGAYDVCRKLSHGHRLQIVTNGIASMQKKRISGSEISGFFENVFVSEDTGYHKPQKGFFDYVFRVLGENMRSSSLIIGDSLSADIAGGISAGIATCYLDNNGTARNENISADYVITDITGILPILGE